MSNTVTEPAQLPPEIQKQLSALTTQLSSASDDLKKQSKQVISALVTENITLNGKRSIKADKYSKS